jgi:release factor glutamine methyltransferase
VANLPYIASVDLDTLPAAVRHEPMLALDGGPDGLRLIDRLLGRLPAALAPGGLAALEIGADQGVTAAERIADRLPGWPARIQAVLAGLPRVAVVERPA